MSALSDGPSATLDAVSNIPPGQAYGVSPSGYRLPAETCLGRVRLQVSDLDRSVAYYRNVLGFRAIDANGHCDLAPRDDDRVIAELYEFRGARHVPPGGRLGLYHFAVLLPDRVAMGRLVRHLLEAGIQFGSADHAVSESIYLWDPDGLGIEVYADRPRDSWQTRGRELVMGTDLLDLQSLVAMADGDWNGIPPGTTMGHVHLSVGDLDWSRQHSRCAASCRARCDRDASLAPAARHTRRRSDRAVRELAGGRRFAHTQPVGDDDRTTRLRA